MNKRFFVLAGIIIILLLGLGEVFFFSDKLGLSNETEFDSTPTQWSQKEDYLIEETSEGTIVTNKTAGFSFKVPNAWKIEGVEGTSIDEYAINLISPNAEIKKDKYGNFIEFGIRIMLGSEAECVDILDNFAANFSIY